MRCIRSAGQNVSPSDDGRLYDQAFMDGLFGPATFSATSGNSVAISALYGILAGRDFTVEAQTIAVELPQDGTANGYIFVEIDTSASEPLSIGSALAPFTPTQEDINNGGAVAQMVLATYTASAVAVTSVTANYPVANCGPIRPGSIATVEISPTTAAHDPMDYILYGGQLYRVHGMIPAGTILVPGSNITAETVGERLKADRQSIQGLNQSIFNLSTDISDLDGRLDDAETNISKKATSLKYALQTDSHVYLKFQNTLCGFLILTGTLGAGWGYCAYWSGYATGSRCSASVIKNDIGAVSIRIDSSDNVNPQIEIINTSGYGISIMFLDIAGGAYFQNS